MNILEMSDKNAPIVPISFPAETENISFGSAKISQIIKNLRARYPFLYTAAPGRSVLGRPLWCLRLGAGPRRILYNASHHANEWITTPLLLRFAEELCAGYSGKSGDIDNKTAKKIFAENTLYIIPAVNPDGIDLVTGNIFRGAAFEAAKKISRKYPEIPFPSGWKANIRGVDLNLQYPAGWENAREIKFAKGFISPAPRDYVGSSPLEAPESRALYELTQKISPAVTVSYHTQGRVIYWKYLDREVPGARETAERMSALSGYIMDDTPIASGYAGYKDWFIDRYTRPGFTIEAGEGESPLPIGDFEKIYEENIGILLAACAPLN